MVAIPGHLADVAGADRRRARLRDAGVLPIAQGMAENTLSTYVVAQHVGERPGSFSVYWAVKDDSPIKTVADLKGKTVGISIIGGGTHGPFALMLKRAGVDPERTSSWSRCRSRSPRMRCGRAASMPST